MKIVIFTVRARFEFQPFPASFGVDEKQVAKTFGGLWFYKQIIVEVEPVANDTLC